MTAGAGGPLAQPPRRVAVVGAGLIGGSVALRLAATGVDLRVWDAAAPTRAALRRRGLDCPEPLAAALEGAQLVVLAAPLRDLASLCDRVRPLLAGDCLVTDVGSTKSAVSAHARSAGLAGRFVGGHPMAGAAGTGFRAASADLLVGAPWALCVDEAPLPQVRRLAGFLTTHFDARVVPTGAAAHDEAVALVSQVPHLLAAVLASVAAPTADPDLARALAAASFCRATASAASAPARTSAMTWDNRAAVRAALGRLRAALDDADALLGRADDADLAALFAAAHARVAGPPAPAAGGVAAFGHDAAGAERQFLLRLGAGGGHVRACAVDTAGVRYTYRGRPRPHA